MFNKGQPITAQWFVNNVRKPVSIRWPVGIAASVPFNGHPIATYRDGHSEVDRTFFRPAPHFLDELVCYNSWRRGPISKYWEDYLPPEPVDPIDRDLLEREYAEYPVWMRG
jgi:hypothetical protein